jgi:hypothetical protein
MGSEAWSSDDIGSGKTLTAMVQAITVPNNNLLAIDDRNGPDTRAQFPLEKALSENRTAEMEGFFHTLYTEIDPTADADLFSRAVDLFDHTYPLIGHFFFLGTSKNSRRCAPEDCKPA